MMEREKIPDFLRHKDKEKQEIPYKEFEVSLEHLDKSEKETTVHLREAAKIVGEISLIQKNTPEFYYPGDASEDEIIAAWQENPSLHSTYTRVVRGTRGSLEAIPYSQNFKSSVEKASRNVRRAAEVTADPLLKRNLFLLSKALTTDGYREQEIDWLEQWRPTTINTFLGPKESYNDELFGLKGDYLATVGVLNEPMTRKSQELVDWMLRLQKKRRDPKVTVRVDDVLILGGVIKDFEWTACTYPNDPEVAKEYGSKITIFNNMHEEVFKRKIMPTIRSIFTEDSIARFDDKELAEASLVWLTLHEGSHPLSKYPDEQERLRSYYHIINELQCSVMGLTTAYQLFERRVLTHKEFEAVVAVHLGRIFVDYAEYELQEKHNLKSYTIGSVINFNFWLDQAGLKIKDGKLMLPGPEELIGSTETLDGTLDYHARANSYSAVRDFVQRHDNFRTLSFADSSLRSIFPKQVENLIT